MSEFACFDQIMLIAQEVYCVNYARGLMNGLTSKQESIPQCYDEKSVTPRILL